MPLSLSDIIAEEAKPPEENEDFDEEDESIQEDAEPSAEEVHKDQIEGDQESRSAGSGADEEVRTTVKMLASSANDEEEDELDGDIPSQPFHMTQPIMNSMTQVQGEHDRDLPSQSFHMTQPILNSMTQLPDSQNDEDSDSSRHSGGSSRPIKGISPPSSPSNFLALPTQSTQNMERSPSARSSGSENSVLRRKATPPKQMEFVSSQIASDNENESGESDDDETNEQYTDMPDPRLLDVISDEKLSRKDLNNLPWWSYLVVHDKDDHTSWHLPYRDAKGRLNRPLLGRARLYLTDEKLCSELGLKLTSSVLHVARRSFELCWPGQPIQLVEANSLDEEEERNQLRGNLVPIQSTRSILEETRALNAKLVKSLNSGEPHDDTKILDANRRIVEVESDVAPHLVKKLQERRKAMFSAMQVKSAAINKGTSIVDKSQSALQGVRRPNAALTLRPAMSTSLKLSAPTAMTETKLRLVVEAKMRLAQVRAIKKRTDAEVQISVEDQNPSSAMQQQASEEALPEEKVPEPKADPDAEDDGEWKPSDDDGDEDSEDGDGDGEGDSESSSNASEDDSEAENDDEVDSGVVLLEGEDELGGQEGGHVPEATTDGDGHQTVTAFQPDQKDTEIVEAASEDAENAERDEKKQDEAKASNEVKPELDRNAQYRAMLQQEMEEAKRKRKSRFVEEEAEEEEEEEQVGVYSFTEKVIGQDDDDENENERNLRVTADDLKHIVDTNSDDEGDNQAVQDMYQKQLEEKDEQMLKRVQKDLENHTFLNRRRKLLASGIYRALNDVDSDAETDEEMDMAREKRFEEEMKRRMKEAQENAQQNGAKKGVILGETVEEIAQEQEQTKRFLEMAKKLKRSGSITASQQSLPAPPPTAFRTSSSSQNFTDDADLDDDSQVVLESLRRCTSSQNSLYEFEHSNSQPADGFLSQRESSLTGPLASLSRISSGLHLGKKPPNFMKNAKTMTSMTSGFVYTKRVKGLPSDSVDQVAPEESEDVNARPPMSTEATKPIMGRARTIPLPSNSTKRRIPLVNAKKLPTANLLALTSFVEGGSTRRNVSA